MCKAIYFDMDGTIADLYNVEDWENKLTSHNVTPYQEAAPMWDMKKLNCILTALNLMGVTIGVVSWLAIGSNKDYDKQTRKAKKEWIEQYLPCIEEIHFVKHGTPKHNCVKVKAEAILIDDNAEVCGAWTRGNTINPTCEDIVEKLENLLYELTGWDNI